MFKKCADCGERHPSTEEVREVILYLAKLIREAREEGCEYSELFV